MNVHPAGGYGTQAKGARRRAVRRLDARTDGGGTAELRWRTVGPFSPSAFVVEHRRDSTAAWSELGSVAAADSVEADTSRGAAYRFRAEDLSVGIHQFRLRVEAEGAKRLFTSRAVSAEIRLTEAGLSSGTYFVRVRGEAFAETRRLTVVR